MLLYASVKLGFNRIADCTATEGVLKKDDTQWIPYLRVTKQATVICPHYPALMASLALSILHRPLATTLWTSGRLVHAGSNPTALLFDCVGLVPRAQRMLTLSALCTTSMQPCNENRLKTTCHCGVIPMLYWMQILKQLCGILCVFAEDTNCIQGLSWMKTPIVSASNANQIPIRHPAHLYSEVV